MTEQIRDRIPENSLPPRPGGKTDLRCGSQDLLTGPDISVNWRLIGISGAIILAFSLWTIFAPTQADHAMLKTVEWISTNLGWVYVVTVASVILFILYVAFSREGTVRLGPDHSRPQYGFFTWVAMLFAAGVGIDLLFYAVAEPVSQYYTPPTGEGRTPEAAGDAVASGRCSITESAGGPCMPCSVWLSGTSPTAGTCHSAFVPRSIPCSANA